MARERGHALAVMGNHELNAIPYHTGHPEIGLPLRPHSEKTRKQHQSFLDQTPLDDPATQDVINWFKTLPLFLELTTNAGLNVYEVDDDGDEPDHIQFGTKIRVVHACWNRGEIDYVIERLGYLALTD